MLRSGRSLGIAFAAVGLLAIMALQITIDPPARRTEGIVTLPAFSPLDGSGPAPRATSAAQAALTLRGSGSPPVPETLRDSPAVQAAYDVSARPGDFVTPPSVSVEH